MGLTSRLNRIKFLINSWKIKTRNKLLSSSRTTFKVHDVQPAKYTQTSFPLNCKSDHVITELKQFKSNNCTQVLGSTKFSNTSGPTKKTGFVNTVLKCYAGHHNLVIRPEDIWIAILTQFSLYINANSEEFRHLFVNFGGQKKLVVEMDGDIFSTAYDQFINLMADQIDENLVDKELKAWILPNFTTTTPDDVVTAGAIFMATMKNYFQYSLRVFCGIPNITLEGAVSDYEDILNRLEKLKSYKLHEWVDMLKPILKQFIAAKKGKIDLEFWRGIVNMRGSCDIEGEDYCQGWISVFAIFGKNGDWQGFSAKFSPKGWPTLHMADIPLAVVETDVKIIDCAKEYKAVLFAGHMAFELLDDLVSLRPKSGWAIALKDENESQCSGNDLESENWEDGTSYI